MPRSEHTGCGILALMFQDFKTKVKQILPCSIQAPLFFHLCNSGSLEVGLEPILAEYKVWSPVYRGTRTDNHSIYSYQLHTKCMTVAVPGESPCRKASVSQWTQGLYAARWWCGTPRCRRQSNGRHLYTRLSDCHQDSRDMAVSQTGLLLRTPKRIALTYYKM